MSLSSFSLQALREGLFGTIQSAESALENYLLKPIDIGYLKRAIEKFNNINRTVSFNENFAEAIQNISKQYKNRFTLSCG